MFLLNTIFGSSNTGPIDGFNKLFETENKVEELEALLKSIYMGGTLDDATIDAVKQQLAQAMGEEFSLLQTLGDTFEHDPSVRYNEIKSDEVLLEQKIKELQAKLDTLNTAPVISENDDAKAIALVEREKEIAKVTEELNRLTSYKAELTNSDKFWSELTSSHKQFEVSMQRKDEFFNGSKTDGVSSGGYNRLLELEGLLQYLEGGGNGSEYDTNKDMNGIQLVQNINNLNDKNEIRDKIIKLKTELLNEIPTIKNETWFKTFLDGSGDSLTKIDTEAQTLQKKINDLNKAFTSMIAGEVNEISIGGVLYKDISGIKDQISRTNSYLLDLDGSKSFINQIKNIASANDTNKAIEDAKKSLLSELTKSSQAEQVTSAMYRTMELQGLLTNLNVDRKISSVISGVDNSNVDAVEEALNAAKENEARLREESGITTENTSAFSLTFARKMNELVGDRISDLQGFESYLTQANQTFYRMIRSLGYMSPDSYYFDNPNLVAVRMNLQRVEEYKKGMDEIEAYWVKIVKDNNENPAPSKPVADKTSETAKILTARTEKKVSNFREIFDFVSDRDSVEYLESREASIKDEIEFQVSRLNALVNSSPTFTSDKQKAVDKIGELKSSLRNIIQQKSNATLMEQIGNSVKETLSKESIYHGIYSSYS